MSNVSSGPVTFVFEVGPVEFFAKTPAQARKNAHRSRRQMEQQLRDYWRVGKRNSVIQSRLRLEGETLLSVAADQPCSFMQSGDTTPCPEEWPDRPQMWCGSCLAKQVIAA